MTWLTRLKMLGGILAGVVFAMSDYSFLAVMGGIVLAVGVVSSLYKGLRVQKQH